VASSLSKQQKICCLAKIKISFDPQNKGQGGGAGYDLSYESLEDHVDILHPHGERVGVDAGEMFDDELIHDNV
jgi:hypothetical protein